jgi:UDP-N-acetylglucosamine 2-epimerase (non-hydrolysing)
MQIDLIAGARPNFMKIAPIIEAIEKAKNDGKNINYRLVHTGQHYDKKMSGNFFEELGIPEPHINLEAGSGTQAEQTATIMVRYEKALMENRPDMVMVVGDVTSTMACSITAKKLNNIKVAHVEGESVQAISECRKKLTGWLPMRSQIIFLRLLRRLMKIYGNPV